MRQDTHIKAPIAFTAEMNLGKFCLVCYTVEVALLNRINLFSTGRSGLNKYI